MGDTDGGMIATDGGPGVDAAVPLDSGPIATIDAGGGRPRTSGGCGCRTGGAASSGWLALGLAGIVLGALRRRR
jgi:MYXO-CTERM domain-containing protein